MRSFLARSLATSQGAMPIPSRIFIHVGINKTGTSCVQHELAQNRSLLKEGGILYPYTGSKHDAHYLISSGLGFCHSRVEALGAAKDLARIKEQLHREAWEGNCRDVLISSEMFSMPRNLEAARDFFSDYECRIIIYLRRHDHWWRSVYSQAVKSVADPPWKSNFKAYWRYTRKHHPRVGDYRRLVDHWASAFGEKAMIVRPYETGQNRPHIVADILKAIGRQDIADRLPVQIPVVNPGIHTYQLMQIDTVQRLPIDASAKQRIVGWLIEQQRQEKDVSPIPPDLQRRLISDNEADYAYIATKYMGRSDGQLFHESLPEPNEGWAMPKSASQTELLAMVVEALTR